MSSALQEHQALPRHRLVGGFDARCAGLWSQLPRLNIIDALNREIVHTEVDTSIISQRLVRIFEQIRQERPLPQVLRTDKGPEFLGNAFTAWAKANGMAIQ